jgi:hypothetical protein
MFGKVNDRKGKNDFYFLGLFFSEKLGLRETKKWFSNILPTFS